MLNVFCWKNRFLTIIGRLYGLFLFAVAIVSESVFNVRIYNFGIVNDGEFYRSAQPSRQFLKRLIRKQKIKTIMAFVYSIPDFEIREAKLNNVKITHLKMSVFKGPSESDVKKFLEAVKNKINYPILIHCSVGSDRTGLMIAIKRVEVDGWTVEEAEKEMFFYRNIPILTPMPKRFLEQWFKTEH